MNPKIALKKIWLDEDVAEFVVTVIDGVSTFKSKVYVGYDYLKILIKELSTFKDQIYGGLYDIEMGEFGPEYASGAFKARLHYYVPGKLSIATHQKTEFFDFSNRKEAAESKMYLKTELNLLDNFIAQLQKLNSGDADEAELECA